MGVNRTFKKYFEIVSNAEFIQEQEIISLRSWLNKKSSRGYGDFIQEDKDQAERVFDAFQNRETPLKITPKQTEKGLAWLLNAWKTPTGKERKNNPFGIREQNVLADFKSFELVDFDDRGRNGWSSYLPVYQVTSHKHGSFTYTAGCWQGQENGLLING